MKKQTNHLKLFLLSSIFALLSACTSAIDEQGYTYDPWEPMNRKIFAFNEGIDTIILKPVAKGYEFITPRPVRTGVNNFFGNLSDMGSLVNAILQLDGQATAGIAARVINNTFFGLGGIFDVATPLGNPKIERNFGSTLAHYGVKSGPYVVLPFFGPSTVRDGIGMIPDAFLNPVFYVDDDATRISLYALGFVNARTNLFSIERQLENIGTDKYSAMRDYWLQYRWAQLGTPVSQAQQDDIDALFAE